MQTCIYVCMYVNKYKTNKLLTKYFVQQTIFVRRYITTILAWMKTKAKLFFLVWTREIKKTTWGKLINSFHEYSSLAMLKNDAQTY